MKQLIVLAFTSALSLPAIGMEANPGEPQSIQWPDGTRYEGGVVDGKQHGDGTIYWLDGSRFDGTFADGRREGPGTLTTSQDKVFRGVYESDVLVSTRGEVVAMVKPAPAVEAPSTSAKDASMAAEKAAADALVAELERMVDRWSTAWSSQDLQAYLALYSETNSPVDGLARNRWLAQREDRLQQPDFIQVETSKKQVNLIAPDMAEIRFNQQYSSNLYSDETMKQLTVKREAGGWKIVKEASL